MGRPPSEDPKKGQIRLRCTEKEIDFFDRCVAHSSMGRTGGMEDNRSSFVRYLFTEYAAIHGIPFDPSAPAPLTADQMFAKLGIVKSNVEHHTVDASSLEGNIDPDRFDESNTSTLDPLPARRVR